MREPWVWYDASGRWVRCVLHTRGEVLTLELRAVPKTQAMIWRWKRLAVVNSAASKVIRRDMAVLPS